MREPYPYLENQVKENQLKVKKVVLTSFQGVFGLRKLKA